MTTVFYSTPNINRPESPVSDCEDSPPYIFETWGDWLTDQKSADMGYRIRGYDNLDDPNDTIRITLKYYKHEEHELALARAHGSIEVNEKTLVFGPVEFEGHDELVIIPSIPKSEFPFTKTRIKAHVIFEMDDSTCQHFKSPTMLDCFAAAGHYEKDFEIRVGEESVKVHRHFLAMLSPVFNAMLTHDTIESKTNTLTIEDFDIETVKNTFDFCYGKVEEKPIFKVIDMLKFADKYDIKAVTDRFHDHVEDAIMNNFCAVARYAWDLKKIDLKIKCIEYYKMYHDEITITKEFVELPVDVRDTILREALALVKEDDDNEDSD